MTKQILFTVLALMAISLTVLANAPKKIILNYNKETKMLSADIIHKVKEVSSHYISDVIIYVNDKEVQTVSFEQQTETKSEVIKYQLKDIKVGDEIMLVAKCNKFGKKSAKIVVE